MWPPLSTDPLSLPSVFWIAKSILTGESDVESFVGNREVGEKADLSRVISKQACAERRRQSGARQSPEGLREAAVLRHQQMVVRTLQVEGVEGELDTWTREKDPFFFFFFKLWPLHKQVSLWQLRLSQSEGLWFDNNLLHSVCWSTQQDT